MTQTLARVDVFLPPDARDSPASADDGLLAGHSRPRHRPGPRPSILLAREPRILSREQQRLLQLVDAAMNPDPELDGFLQGRLPPPHGDLRRLDRAQGAIGAIGVRRRQAA